MTAPGVAGRELSSLSPTGTRLGPMPAGTALCPHQCHPAMAITFTGLSRSRCAPRPNPAVSSPAQPPWPLSPGSHGSDIQMCPLRPHSSCSHCHPRAIHPAVAPMLPKQLFPLLAHPDVLPGAWPVPAQLFPPSPWPVPSTPHPISSHPMSPPAPPVSHRAGAIFILLSALSCSGSIRRQ